ncbi:MAG: hypothetical protein UT22_C0038G0001, partial [Parcubacteria group bacterium GW2011_GWC2_39_11]
REFLVVARARIGWGKGNTSFSCGAFRKAKYEKLRRKRGRGGRGVWGAPKQSKTRYGVKIPLARAEAKPRRPARQEQSPAKKFSFPFRRKKNRAPNKKMRRKLFCGVASVSERRRGGASVSFKEGSRIFKQSAPNWTS